MKVKTQILTFYIFLFGFVLFVSCRTEETIFKQAPEDEVLIYNSSVSSLIKNISLHDGSIDNIVDKANCYTVKLPITVIANGVNLVIENKEDYKKIEYLFDDDDDDNDSLILNFPITIILEDFTQVSINSYNQLNNYASRCKGENELDDDIECLDFVFPISASFYNTSNEVIKTVVIDSDKQLFSFIKNLKTTDFVTIKFPITVILYDKTQKIINNLVELKSLIESYDNVCDEDDDYDYNDDDCDDCNQQDLINILTGCSGWTIDKLERYGNDYDDYYYGYTFNFRANGTVSVYYANTTEYGTYTTSGTGNNLIVTINIPNLPYCNNNWVLHEISIYTETKLDLRVGNNDRMRYKNKCK